MSQTFFHNRKVNTGKLLSYSFAPDASGYCYARDIAEGQFRLAVWISDEGKVQTQVIDKEIGDELEFLWKKFPDNAIWRRKDTNKWYAALLTVSRRTLGMDSDEMIVVLDLRMKSEMIAEIVDHMTYFPGYHMNKTHWITICLDGSVSCEEIFGRIDDRYRLAVKWFGKE